MTPKEFQDSLKKMRDNLLTKFQTPAYGSTDTNMPATDASTPPSEMNINGDSFLDRLNKAYGNGKLAEGFSNPLTQGLLTAGLSMLATPPRAQPYSNLEVLGQSGLAGMGAMEKAQTRIGTQNNGLMNNIIEMNKMFETGRHNVATENKPISGGGGNWLDPSTRTVTSIPPKLIAPIAPKDYTPESVSKYSTTGNVGDLVRNNINAESDIGKLMADRDKLPAGDPNRNAYDAAILKHTALTAQEKNDTNTWIARSEEKDSQGHSTPEALAAQANIDKLIKINQQKVVFGINIKKESQNNIQFNPRQQGFIDQQVRALVEDRTTPTLMRQAMATGGMGMAPERQAIAQEIWNRLYTERPNYDTTAAEANFKGKTNALAINRVQLAKTVIPIADEVITITKKIPPGIGFVPADEFKRKLGRYLNDADLIRLEFTKNKMVEEFERMLTGTQMADTRVQRNLDLIRTGYDPKAIAFLAEETKKIAGINVSAVGSPMYPTDKGGGISQPKKIGRFTVEVTQ